MALLLKSHWCKLKTRSYMEAGICYDQTVWHKGSQAWKFVWTCQTISKAKKYWIPKLLQELLSKLWCTWGMWWSMQTETIMCNNACWYELLFPLHPNRRHTQLFNDTIEELSNRMVNETEKKKVESECSQIFALTMIFIILYSCCQQESLITDIQHLLSLRINYHMSSWASWILVILPGCWTAGWSD